MQESYNPNTVVPNMNLIQEGKDIYLSANVQFLSIYDKTLTAFVNY